MTNVIFVHRNKFSVLCGDSDDDNEQNEDWLNDVQCTRVTDHTAALTER